MDPSETCAKCMTPVGNDAVFLKNGTYMCPTCYQRMYPAKKAPSRPKRIDISVEGVIAILAVIGVFVGGYFTYKYVTESRRAEAVAAREAEEAADRRRQEELAAAEARAARIAQDQKDADARAYVERMTKAEAAKLANAERIKNLELAKAEAEQRRVAEEKRLAELRAKVRHDDQAVKETDARARGMEIAALARTFSDANKTIVAAERSKPDQLRKSIAYKSLLHSAEETKATLLRQYFVEFPRTLADDPKEIPHWRNPPSEKLNPTKSASGQGSVSIDRSGDYAKLVAKFDSALKQIQSSEEGLRLTTDELAKADAAIGEAKAKIDECNRRLVEMKATNAEVAEAGASLGPVAAQVTTKTIFKKDGSQIKALSVMTVENEVRYKDATGNWQVINKADVDKIQ